MTKVLGLDVALRKRIGWALIGNMALALSWWVIFALTANFTDQTNVGELSLSLASTAPVFLFFDFNLKVVQATARTSRFGFGGFLATRLLAIPVAWLACAAIWYLVGVEAKSLVFLGVIFARSTESMSGLMYGHLIRLERLDIVGRSLLFRAGLGTGAAAIAISQGSLAAGVLALAAGWMVVLAVHDMPQTSKASHQSSFVSGPEKFTLSPDFSQVRDVAKFSSPLALDSMVTSLASSLPRIWVARTVNVAALGGFAVLLQLAMSSQILTRSVGESTIAELSRSHQENDAERFGGLLRRLEMIVLLLAVVTIAASVTVVPIVVRIVFGAEYVDRELLVVVFLAIALVNWRNFMGRALQASNSFGTYLLADLVVLFSVVSALYFFVPRYGALGAAWAMVIAYAVAVVINRTLAYRVAAQIGRVES